MTISSSEAKVHPGDLIPFANDSISNSNELDERGHLLGASGKGFQTLKKSPTGEGTVSFPSVYAAVSTNDAQHSGGAIGEASLAGEPYPGTMLSVQPSKESPLPPQMSS